jgi:hypothetical protein
LTLRLPVRGLLARLRHGGTGTVSLFMPRGGDTGGVGESYLVHAACTARSFIWLVDLGDEGGRSQEALARLVQQVRRYTDVAPLARLPAELAVVQGKCDEPGALDPDDPRQGPRYDPRLAQAISDRVAAHLEGRGLGGLVAVARHSFRRVSFFAVSALGSPPRQGSLTDPRPRRVEEPLLWIMHQWGYL